jgi:hypothetical protein
MGTGCGRGRQVPHWTASSTTSPSARFRRSDRCTPSRNGPDRAWSSQTPRPQKRQPARAALAQNQHSNGVSYLMTKPGSHRSSSISRTNLAELPAASKAEMVTVSGPPSFHPSRQLIEKVTFIEPNPSSES